jgi:glycosyltransferase involved in cell wall biosynthesis
LLTASSDAGRNPRSPSIGNRPGLNRRALLFKTLSSLEQQTVDGRQYEVVVVVDGTTDGTAEALTHWSGRMNLRWIEIENGGLARARNRGAEIAVAPVLIFLDDDQRAMPELVERHIGAHERGRSVLVQGFYPVDPHVCGRVAACRPQMA